ncbi:MAG: CoA transferase, partial [bacterium]
MEKTLKHQPAGPFLPLKGVRVLAFELAYSLPAGTRTLAELGAEVVRVAGPARDSFYISVVDGVYFSKRCVGINLKSADGLAVAKQLVAKADVVCSNFVGGVMERLGLGYDVLAAINPSVINLQLSGFGSPGPWSGYPAFGPSTEAAGGMNQLIGMDPEPPIRIGSGVFSDQLGGRFAALALLAALEERQRSGKGRFIDLSMTEAISLLIGHTVVDAALGETPERLGNRDRDYAPQGVYRCGGEDDWIAISVKDDRQWAALAGEMGAAAPAGSFETLEDRRSAHDEIDEAIEGWTLGFEKDELAGRLQKLGVAAHGVAKSRDPLFDEHLRERGLFKTVTHDRPILGYDAHPHPTTPWFAAGFERVDLSSIRFHGADNEPVLADWLAMPPHEVAGLERSGALIAPTLVEVEDRRTGYRDADFDQQLGLGRTGTGELIGPDDGAAATANDASPAPKRTTVLRVVEFATTPAAAFAGLLLAELGHEVIKVELPEGLREKNGPVLSAAERAFFDRRKKCVDLATYLGSIAAGADAVIEDFGAVWPAEIGFSREDLLAGAPSAVVVSISPFGLTGPKRAWQASELIIQASGGPLHSTGWKGERPFKAGGFAAHAIAGVNAATAILGASFGIAAGNTQRVHIDLSMQETYLHHWTRHIGEWTYSGTKMHRERKGFGHQGFRHTAMAADGWLYLLALFASWDEIALFLGLEDFITPEWQDPEYRAEHWPELERPYHERIASRSRYDWFADGSAAG